MRKRMILVCFFVLLMGVTACGKEDKVAETPKEQLDAAEQLTVSVADTQESRYADGIYQGTGAGYHGEIVVEIEVKEGVLASAKIISADGETKPHLKKAEKVLQTTVEENSAEVDTVSGATYSSKGILEGIKAALQQAEA